MRKSTPFNTESLLGRQGRCAARLGGRGRPSVGRGRLVVFITEHG